MTLETWFYIWLGGVFVWTFLMALEGSEPDGSFFLSAFIWPLSATIYAGQLVRSFFQ